MAELDGLDAILDFLAALDYPTAQSSIHSALLACLKALMNNSVSSDSEVAFVCKFRIVLPARLLAEHHRKGSRNLFNVIFSYVLYILLKNCRISSAFWHNLNMLSSPTQQTGRAHVLAHPTGINVIAQSLHSEGTRSKIAALELLVCN